MGVNLSVDMQMNVVWGISINLKELLNPVSSLSNTTPELREIENWYIEIDSVVRLLMHGFRIVKIHAH